MISHPTAALHPHSPSVHLCAIHLPLLASGFLSVKWEQSQL